MYVLWLLTDCEGWGLSLMMKEQVLRFQHKYSSPQTKNIIWILSIESGSDIFLYKEELVSWDYDRAGMLHYCDTCVIITDHLESVTRDLVTAWHEAVTLSTAGRGWLILCPLSGPDGEETQADKHSWVIKQSDVACFVCVLNISGFCPFYLLVDTDPMYVFTHNITFNRSIDIQISHTLLSLQNISVQENHAKFVTKDSE